MIDQLDRINSAEKGNDSVGYAQEEVGEGGEEEVNIHSRKVERLPMSWKPEM